METDRGHREIWMIYFDDRTISVIDNGGKEKYEQVWYQGCGFPADTILEDTPEVNRLLQEDVRATIQSEFNHRQKVQGRLGDIGKDHTL